MVQRNTENRITRNPAVFGGKPIIRGTRISVELIKDWISSGVSQSQILDDYPDLTPEDIQAAIDYDSGPESHVEVRRWRAVG